MHSVEWGNSDTRTFLFCSSDLADDSPPEPAPPEVPPRGPSLHHPLQGHATLRGRSGGSVNYSLSSGPGDADNMDDPDYGRGVGASAGNSCVFLSQGREPSLISLIFLFIKSSRYYNCLHYDQHYNKIFTIY